MKPLVTLQLICFIFITFSATCKCTNFNNKNSDTAFGDHVVRGPERSQTQPDSVSDIQTTPSPMISTVHSSDIGKSNPTVTDTESRTNTRSNHDPDAKFWANVVEGVGRSGTQTNTVSDKRTTLPNSAFRPIKISTSNQISTPTQSSKGD